MGDERDLSVLLFSSNGIGFPLIGRSLAELSDVDKKDRFYINPGDLRINRVESTWSYKKGRKFPIGKSREIKLNGNIEGAIVLAVYPENLDNGNFGAIVRDVQIGYGEKLARLLDS